jgi:hypothetical protein
VGAWMAHLGLLAWVTGVLVGATAHDRRGRRQPDPPSSGWPATGLHPPRPQPGRRCCTGRRFRRYPRTETTAVLDLEIVGPAHWFKAYLGVIGGCRDSRTGIRPEAVAISLAHQAIRNHQSSRGLTDRNSGSLALSCTRDRRNPVGSGSSGDCGEPSRATGWACAGRRRSTAGCVAVRGVGCREVSDYP